MDQRARQVRAGMDCWRATPYGIPGRRRAPTGFAGYGVSLMLFIVALRNLGTACAGDYFLVAPLFSCTAVRRRIVARALARDAARAMLVGGGVDGNQG